MKTAQEITRALSQFYGTSQWYRHWTRAFTYTDGIKYITDNCAAHWLVDAIASYQCEKKVRKEPFQVWTLEVGGNRAVLTMKSDSGKPNIVRQNIDFTDFPLEKIEMYVENEVLCLPSER